MIRMGGGRGEVHNESTGPAGWGVGVKEDRME